MYPSLSLISGRQYDQTYFYILYRDIISHLYIPSGSSLRPVFWDSPYWGIQWPTQFFSIIRLQKQLRIFLKLQGSVNGGAYINMYLSILTYKHWLSLWIYILGGQQLVNKADLGEFEKYDIGPRRDPAEFFKWAGVDLQNNWGPGYSSFEYHLSYQLLILYNCL